MKHHFRSFVCVCFVSNSTKAFQYANQYIQDNDLPLHIPVVRVVEGGSSVAFDRVFN